MVMSTSSSSSSSPQRPVMVSASKKPTKPTRSRKGCQECRRLHQKCDEARPACGSCGRADKTCSYNKPLSWGGRPFSHSSFGKVVAAARVVSVPSEPIDSSSGATPSFVFSLKPPEAAGITRPRRKQKATSEIAVTNTSLGRAAINAPFSVMDRTSIYPTLSWMPWATPGQLSLIHHFTQKLAPCFTLCPPQHDVFCRSFLPLAVHQEQGGPLLAAVLLSALVHRDAISSLENDGRSAALYHTCIRHLHQAWAGQSSLIDSISIATALILCLTSILAGGFRQDAWRLHLNGATALLDSTLPKTLRQSEYLCPTRAFLQRWCRSLRTVGFSSAPKKLQSFNVDVDNEDSVSQTGHYINVFDGFSTDLLSVRQQINDMALEKRAMQDLQRRAPDATRSITDLRLLLDNRCDRLIAHIKSLSSSPSRKLDPHFPPEQLERYHSDFVALNEAYHHCALLELYQRVLNKPPSDLEVQDALSAGIRAMGRVALTDGGSSPGVATLHPVFIMGCAAVSFLARSFILNWLEDMGKLYQMGNVVSAKTFLIQFWQRNDELAKEASHIQWDRFMLEQDWDLSLY